MQPHLKSVEREAAVDFDGELAVDDEAFGAEIAKDRHDLGKIPAERLA